MRSLLIKNAGSYIPASSRFFVMISFFFSISFLEPINEHFTETFQRTFAKTFTQTLPRECVKQDDVTPGFCRVWRSAYKYIHSDRPRSLFDAHSPRAVRFTSFPGLLHSRILLYHACLLLDICPRTLRVAAVTTETAADRRTDRQTRAHTVTQVSAHARLTNCRLSSR